MIPYSNSALALVEFTLHRLPEPSTSFFDLVGPRSAVGVDEIGETTTYRGTVLREKKEREFEEEILLYSN